MRPCMDSFTQPLCRDCPKATLSPPMQALMPDTCCCLYTIRLDATQFQPTKSQSKMLRKWGPGPPRSARTSLKGGSAAASAGREPAGAQEPIMAQLQGVLSTALRACRQSGLLPQVRIAAAVATLCRDAPPLPDPCVQVDQLPVPSISNVSDRQRKLLGINVRYSSPVSLAFSSLLRKLTAGGRPAGGLTGEKHAPSSDDATLDASSIAQVLSRAFNDLVCPVSLGEGSERLSPSQPELPQCLAYTAVPAAGHINFMHAGAAPTSVGPSALRNERCSPGSAAGDDGPHRKWPQLQGDARAAAGGTASAPGCCHGQIEMRTVPAAYDRESFELYRRYQVGAISAMSLTLSR